MAGFTKTFSKTVIPLLFALNVGPVSVTSFEISLNVDAATFFDPNENEIPLGGAWLTAVDSLAGLVAENTNEEFGALPELVTAVPNVVDNDDGCAVVVVVVVALLIGLPNWKLGLLSGFDPKTNEPVLAEPKLNFWLEVKPELVCTLSLVALPILGVSQLMHFSTLFEFLIIHPEHSHDVLFCFAAIDLKILSLATAAAGLGVISV